MDDGEVWRTWKVAKLPAIVFIKRSQWLRKWEGETPVAKISATVESLL